jgi:chemotaxis protein MotB
MKLRAIILSITAAVLMSACVKESTYKKEVSMADTYKQLNAKLQDEIGTDQAQVAELQNLIRVSLENTLLFSEGSVALHQSGEATLNKIAPVLKTLKGQVVEIKGFTDNVPIGPELKARFPNNVSLSKARAETVLKYLASKGVPSSMMTATGYGDAKPVASNDTAQGRAKNRRVEIDIAKAQ